MATIFVERDGSGKVKGVYARPQPGYAEEEIAIDAPEVTAFFASQVRNVRSISDRQFFQQLALDGVISEAEAEAAVATGVIPAAMLALVDALPAGQRFGARMMLMGATVFERHHPLTETIGALYGWDSARIDRLFEHAASL